MVNIKINGQEFEVEKNLTVLQACEKYTDIQIPRFCYHDKLKIAGNCRMCLVEIKPGPPKPSASCAMPVSNNMEVFTESEMVKNARNAVMELLLINHPLDCPVCDQGGECDLQDQAYIYGKKDGNFNEYKRAVEDKYMGPLIQTKMNRCIHCTRCIRFINDIAGYPEIGAIGRGENMEITSLENAISSELSGNIIDLCPVGALTSKSYKGKARSWELTKTPSIDVFDGICSNIRLDTRSDEVLRVIPIANEDINEEWIGDKTRFAIDGINNQRIDSCFISQNKILIKNTYKNTLDIAIKILQKSKNIATITGKMADLQTIYLHKKLSKVINSKIYSCSEEDLNLNISSRGNYIFNSSIKGIDETDFILIIGCNIKKDAPVLHARIRRNFVEKNIPVFVIDGKLNLSYNENYLKNDTSSLFDILNGKSEISKEIKNAKKPMIIVGQDVLCGDYGKDLHQLTIAIGNKFFIKDNWNGYCILHKNASIVGGLDLGFHSSRTSKIMQMTESGEIDCLILNQTSDIDITKVHRDCRVIVFASHGDENIRRASVVFPSLTYVEKTASYINTEGRLQNTAKVLSILDKEFDEHKILCEMIANLDSTFQGKTRLDVNKMLFEEYPHLKNYENKAQSGVLSENIEVNFDLSCSIKSLDYNFYMTDFISRNSVNMANCVKEILMKG